MNFRMKETSFGAKFGLEFDRNDVAQTTIFAARWLGEHLEKYGEVFQKWCAHHKEFVEREGEKVQKGSSNDLIYNTILKIEDDGVDDELEFMQFVFFYKSEIDQALEKAKKEGIDLTNRTAPSSKNPEEFWDESDEEAVESIEKKHAKPEKKWSLSPFHKKK